MNKETEAKYDKLYESYLKCYDIDILKRKEFFDILDKYSEDLPKDFEVDYYDYEFESFEEYIIKNILEFNCITVIVYVNNYNLEIDDINDISKKDFDYIVKFCNKYNLDIVNIDDREDNE